MQLQSVAQRREDKPLNVFAVYMQQSEQMVPSAPSRQKAGVGSAAMGAAPAVAVPMGGWNVLQVRLLQAQVACSHCVS